MSLQATISGPIRGAGVGLRSCHYDYILANQPAIPWFEVLADNYMVDGGSQLTYLDEILAHYPSVLHGVGLSLGSVDPLNQTYLQQLKKLVQRTKPTWLSDHLCWIGTKGQYLHDLLPLPYTDEALQHVAGRIRQVQDFLGQQILIENVSSYFEYNESAMPEWEFLNTLAEQADCAILLDINNIYVSAFNHDFSATTYIENISSARVKQFHLAGFADKRRYLFDSHGEIIHQPVWDLYQQALQRFGAVPTLIEWDENIPEFSVLQSEAAKAQTMMDSLCR